MNYDHAIPIINECHSCAHRYGCPCGYAVNNPACRAIKRSLHNETSSDQEYSSNNSK